jgi:hypothetical protein
MSDKPGEANRADVSEGPPPFQAPVFDPDGGPALDRDNLDSFIEWTAAVPIAGVETIRRRIAAARENQGVFAGLLDRLWDLPAADVSRHGLLLSIIGELRNPDAVQALSEFVWYSGDMTLSRSEAALRNCTFEINGTSMLKARATEMLAWISTEDAYAATRRIAVEHPDAVVRAAAVDAYMFNHGDSEEAANELRQIIEPGDEPLVGLPRLTRDTDREEFERRVLDFYDRYPNERPPEVGMPVPPEPAPRPPSEEAT